MEQKLKSCPFCGGSASITYSNTYDADGCECINCAVTCDSCSVSTEYFSSEQYAEESWNQRVK